MEYQNMTAKEATDQEESIRTDRDYWNSIVENGRIEIASSQEESYWDSYRSA